MTLFYYCDQGGNFGDELSPIIVQKILQKKIRVVNGTIIGRKKRLENYLFALGSIFQYVHDGDVLWGTGVNPARRNPKNIKRLDIRAVRGPLTRDYILNHHEIECPEVYGDPAILLPKLFPEYRINSVRKYGVVPHLRDISYFDEDKKNTMFPNLGWKKLITFILGCELLISSSLHGIIVAEAFGIPARWLRNENLPSNKAEDAFKFNDYYASTGRSQNDWASTVEEAIKMGGKEPVVNFNADKLIASFPHDIFTLPAQILSIPHHLFDTIIIKTGLYNDWSKKLLMLIEKYLKP